VTGIEPATSGLLDQRHNRSDNQARFLKRPILKIQNVRAVKKSINIDVIIFRERLQNLISINIL